MVSRRLVAAVVVLALVPAILAFLFLYQPPVTTGVQDVTSTQQVNESFVLTTSLSTDEGDTTERTVRYDADSGVLYRKVVFPNTSTTTYAVDGRSYTRRSFQTRERFDGFVDGLEAPDERVLRLRNASLTVMYVENDTDPDVRNVPSFMSTTVLVIPPYRAAGTTTYRGRTVEVYEPLNGWGNRSVGGTADRYRVSNTSGVVYVGASDRLYYTNVTFTYTPGGTWGEVMLSRGESETVSLTLRLTERSVTVEKPAWVPAEAG